MANSYPGWRSKTDNCGGGASASAPLLLLLQTTQCDLTMFGLPENVHLCRVSDEFVFLDAKSDRYLLVRGQQASLLASLCVHDGVSALSPDLNEFAKRLSDQGLITDQHLVKTLASGFRSQNATPPAIQLASKPTSVGAKDVVYALIAYLEIRSVVGKHTLLEILEKIQRWRGVQKTTKPHTYAYTQDCAHRALIIAPWFFSRRDACLKECLYVIRVLTLRQMSAELIFGVRTSPFLAHCWVEFEGVPLTEEIAVTNQYTRILEI